WTLGPFAGDLQRERYAGGPQLGAGAHEQRLVLDPVEIADGPDDNSLLRVAFVRARHEPARIDPVWNDRDAVARQVEGPSDELTSGLADREQACCRASRERGHHALAGSQRVRAVF